MSIKKPKLNHSQMHKSSILPKEIKFYFNIWISSEIINNYLQDLLTKNVRLRTESWSLLRPKERDRSSHLYYGTHSSFQRTSFFFKYYLFCFNIVSNFSMVIHTSFQIPTEAMRVWKFSIEQAIMYQLAEHREMVPGGKWMEDTMKLLLIWEVLNEQFAQIKIFNILDIE